MTALHIARIDIFKVSLPKAKPVVIATGTIPAVNVVILRVVLSDGSFGWGEACPYPMITGESQTGIWALAAECAARWIGRDARAIPDRIADLDGFIAGNPTLKSMFDLALHDALARSQGIPLWSLLGAPGPRPIQSDITIYLDKSEDIATTARRFADDGFRVIKIKIGEGFEPDLARVRAVRAAVGADVTLRIDANQGWDVHTARRALAAMASLDIEHCEQPVARWNFSGMRELTATSPIPIMADESLFDHHDAAALVAGRACHMFNLKFAKSSGIYRARQIMEIADAAAIPVQAGGMGETRLGTTALLHFCYAYPRIGYYDLDSCVGHGLDPVLGGMRFGSDGTLDLAEPETPGLGVDFSPEFLATLERRSVA